MGHPDATSSVFSHSLDPKPPTLPSSVDAYLALRVHMINQAAKPIVALKNKPGPEAATAGTEHWAARAPRSRP